MSRNTKTGVTIKKEFVKDKYLEYFLQKETEICYDELVDRVRRLSGEIITNIYDVLISVNRPQESTFGNPQPSFTFNNQPSSFTFGNSQPSFTFNNTRTSGFTFGTPKPTLPPLKNIQTLNLPPSFTVVTPKNNTPHSQNIKTVNVVSQSTVGAQKSTSPFEHINKDKPGFAFEKTKTKKPLDTKVRKFSK
jgi:hypothetical protein